MASKARLLVRSTLVAILALGAVLTGSAAHADPGLVVQQLGEGGPSPDDLVTTLVGEGVASFSNVTYTGADHASGSFSGGADIVGFADGVLLTSGAVTNVVGPNAADGTGTQNGLPGDADLTALAGATNDASVLEFDFVPTESGVTFRYVFASEEYNEFVYQGFNDVFAFFVNGENCALVPGTTDEPVSVDTINGGNPFGDENASNPDLYRNNDLEDGGGAIDTEMDGLTQVLTCTAAVTPDVTNHIKLAIADTGDSFLDSAVFLEAGSFSSGEESVPGAPRNVAAFPGDGSATVDWDAPISDGGSPIDLYEVTCVATEDPEDQQTASTPDGSTTALTVGGLTNGVAYACTVRAHNAVGFGPSSDPSNPVTPSAASEATVIDGEQGGTVTTTSPGLKGQVKLRPGATSDEVVVSLVLSSDDAPAPDVPACSSTICLDLAITPSDAYPSTRPVSIVLQFLSIPPDPLGDVLTRPVFKDEVLIDTKCPTKPVVANPDPCWQKRRLVGNNDKWEQIVVLASSEDPRYRT